MNKIPTAVLVSGGGTNLQAILDASARGEIPDADIALVLSSQSSAYALVRAEQAGIAHLALEKKAFPYLRVNAASVCLTSSLSTAVVVSRSNLYV